MNTNTIALIKKLHGLGTLDGRFKNIRVLNCDPTTGVPIDHMGVLSVVFVADDDITGEKVAIKFFNPDISDPIAVYRFPAFQREVELLEHLKDKSRCLQIVSDGISSVELTATDPSSGTTIKRECSYFVVEWIEDDILSYFRTTTTADKDQLLMFRRIALAVFALHRYNVTHRDLKPDNLRSRDNEVIAIDLGTAKLKGTPRLGNPKDYASPVGAPFYAPIEMELSVGVSEHFALCIKSDMYSLGCMLFELFNPDFYTVRLLSDTGFARFYAASRAHMIVHARGSTDVLEAWHKAVSRYGKQVTLPSLGDSGSTAPKAVVPILDRLLHSLTHIDYRRRISSPDEVIRVIDTAIKILDNHDWSKKVIERKREYREYRIRKQQQKQQRLENRLGPNVSSSR